MRVIRRCAVVLVSMSLLVGGLTGPAAASGPTGQSETRTAERLSKQVTVAGANRHLIALQRIADKNGGNRAAQSATNPADAGFRESVGYVRQKMLDAGFDVQVQDFTYPVEVTVAGSVVAGAANFTAIKLGASIDTPNGGVTGPLAVVPEDATTGCEPSDFAGASYTGSVALIRRGGCTFATKTANAAAAGAVVVVISNNVPGPLANVTLGAPEAIAAGGISQADGTALATRAGTAVTVDLRTEEQTRTSQNVIAQTRTGRTDNVVMLGAHLDSVPAGPGINDNGTGSAALLEIAQKLGGSPKLKTNNAVRFAWWGAEELGLLGSEAYVAGLPFEQQLNIALYLNFDMIGSPNAGYFVYQGSADGAPFGSAQIEQTFVQYLGDQRGIQTRPTDFDGRSDYGPFIAVGIPSGGLFTGAEGLKTADEAALWGGTAGVAYDRCYHQKCDNLGNLDRTALGNNLKAAAWAAGLYAVSTESINGVPARDQRAALRSGARIAALQAPVDLDEAA